MLLADKYELFTVTSTRQILEPVTTSVGGAETEALIYGGILYDLDENKLTELSTGYLTGESGSRSAVVPDDASRGSSWTYLAGTLDEANKISSLMEGISISANLLSGENTTEESFKNIRADYNPSIIHLATHGFFFPEPEDHLQVSSQQADLDDNVFKTSENPLMRSGLILAGANRVWQGGDPIPGVDDGILTAYEVANTNLSGTDLVVLSACETGLGDIQGSEGVYGLQRSFKMAGADYIIMSLWQVPDQQTVELMTLFYENWLSGTEIREAFAKAQMQMRAKYEPFYWAAFLLIK
jgi:CHAT domain-containing protein